MKKLTALALAIAICVSAGIALTRAGYFPALTAETASDGSFAAQTDALLSENLPQSEELARMAFSLRYISGQRKFGDVYIADDSSLIRDIAPPADSVLNGAVNAITRFVDAHDQRTYLMLVPTAAIIKQQEIPQYAAESLYNQRHMITDCYQKLAGTVTAVDVYQTLFSHRSEYIYYNTEENLTGLGGFYVYEVLGERLGVRVRGRSSFDIRYGQHGFYGSLAEGFPPGYAASDVAAMYEYSSYEREFSVLHTDSSGEVTAQSGLYAYDGEWEDSTDVILGGLSPITDIESEGPYSEWLLVFGDGTVKSWLPFLALHYAHITYVDLREASPEQLGALDVSDYQQVLFGYGVGDYIENSGLENLCFIN